MRQPTSLSSPLLSLTQLSRSAPTLSHQQTLPLLLPFPPFPRELALLLISELLNTSLTSNIRHNLYPRLQPGVPIPSAIR
jgi:hypothetical protein